MISIYVLTDPRTDAVRYVGVSCNPHGRFLKHMKEARHGVKTHKCDWIRELLALNLKPSQVIIEEDLETYELAYTREQHWFDHYIAEGADLTNHPDHIGDGMSPTEASRIFTEYWQRPGSREHQSKIATELWQDPDFRERVIAAMAEARTPEWHAAASARAQKRGQEIREQNSETRACVICNDKFTCPKSSKKRVCGDPSKNCKQILGHQTRAVKGVRQFEGTDRVCAICGNPFTVANKYKTAKTCSHACAIELRQRSRYGKTDG